MLHILLVIGLEREVETDRLCIFDFYALFPEKARAMHFRRSETELRSSLAQCVGRAASPYRVVTNERRLFAHMQPYQHLALRCLAARGVLSPERLRQGYVRVTDVTRVRQLAHEAGTPSTAEASVIVWLCHNFRTLPLGGEYGLRYRTRLMEYKYDSI